MPGYTKNTKWFYTDTAGKLYTKKHTKAFSKLKAAWRGKKVRNQWYAGRKGYLNRGKFHYN